MAMAMGGIGRVWGLGVIARFDFLWGLVYDGFLWGLCGGFEGIGGLRGFF